MDTFRRFLCFFIFLSGTQAGHAQTYKVTQFGAKDSLSSSPVHDISQDSAGFIWIASDRGLIRYNGNYFVPVHNDSITFIEFYRNEFLAAHRVIYKFRSHYPFDDISFETLPVKLGETLNDPYLTITASGGLWWADESGIHSYSNNKHKDFRFIGLRKPGFIFSELNGSLIAIERSGQLFYLSERENSFVPVVGGNIHSRVNDALVYSDSSMVIATDQSLLMVRVKRSDLLATNVLKGGEKFTRVAKDKQGNIWAATDENRLLKFYHSGGKFIMRGILDGTEPHRISDLQFPTINKLFIDRHNNLWVCHKKGLALVSEIPFVLVDPELPNEIIRSAAFMDEGKAYLSGIAGFFETVDMGFNDYEVRPAKIGKNIYPNAICKCGNRLWLGTVNDELYYLENGKVSPPLYNSNALNIFYLFCDSSGDLWVSRGQKNKPLKGIIKFTKDLELKEYNGDYGFSTRMLVTKEDSKGNVFVAGIGDSTYLYRYVREKEMFVNISKPMRFEYGENFEVHDFAISEDSTFWLASTAGLLVLKEDSIRKVNIDELNGREVVAVTISEDGVVWAATEKDGLIRYTSDEDYAVFNIQAGLQSGIMWYRSLFTDKKGKLWAGSREGITVSSQPNPRARKTERPILLSLTSNGSGNIRKHVFNFESTLVIGFVSLNYPTRTIEYQYRMNSDASWTNLRLENEIVLPKMQNGKYTLNIRARQAGGYYWSEPLNYSFTVLRPWYFSREAFLIYGVILVIVMVFGTRLYNRRLIREKNRLEIKVRKRTKELVRKQDEIIAQNQELHQLSDVLAANNENIVIQKEIIEKQNFLLQQAKNELEKKVEERTHELKFANEELAQQNVQLEQFAFMTAHNLRAPVARLLGLTSLLEIERTSDPHESELLKRIKESSKSLDETIREISEILHIKKGLHGSFMPVNLKSVWDRILPTFAHEIEGNRIAIQADFPNAAIVRGIEPFVYSVFYNIISNGIKYADSRKQSYIKVFVQEKEADLFVVFEDNGIGFNSFLYADKLFKPFTRFNNIKEGRGLGLYLMKIQMEMMGGDIQLVSHQDEGTKITLRFVSKDQEGSGIALANFHPGNK